MAGPFVTPALASAILSARILVVGSGGIGCELLKNLSLSGFVKVEVIDLDTIDVSNLNRQFLFRQHHVGQPKCVVACEAARNMSRYGASGPPPEASSASKASEDSVGFFLAHHGNVKDNTRFGVKFFKRFDVVLNALDNVDARRHVNRLCIAAELPLIEAGTTGYLGQATVIVGGLTECYECQAKPTQKVYPICTIRSTPSMPVHCIVWAKELYKLMFGDAASSMLFEDTANSDERSTFMAPVVDGRLSLTKAPSSEELLQYTQSALTALFHTEIEKQLAMDRYKTSKKTPTALAIEPLMAPLKPEDPPPSAAEDGEKVVWTNEQCAAELHSVVAEMYTKPPADLAGDLFTGAIEFDKDSDIAMRFVTAASNLRCRIFDIDASSYYAAKGIAGNIVPAIATTNAIVAGQEVIELLKILKHGKDSIITKCKTMYCLRDKTRKGLVIQPSSLEPPNPNCYVCKNACVTVRLDTATWTLQRFIDEVLKKKMSFNSPIIQIGTDQIYEESEDGPEEDYVQNLPKTLEELPAGGIKDGTSITVEDFDQDMEVTLILATEVFEEEEDQFVVGGEVKAKVAAAAETKEEEKKEAAATADDDDDICVMDDDEIKEEAKALKAKEDAAKGGSKKGKRGRKESDENAEPAAKKSKAVAPVQKDDDEIVVIE
jgi:ubiquitin-like 1-activating enzyme E1 B